MYYPQANVQDENLNQQISSNSIKIEKMDSSEEKSNSKNSKAANKKNND